MIILFSKPLKKVLTRGLIAGRAVTLAAISTEHRGAANITPQKIPSS
jgi:hypothetical protein